MNSNGLVHFNECLNYVHKKMKHSNQKYPSKDHARKVAARLRVTGRGNNGVIYLEGQKTIMMEDNDEVIPFRY